MPNFIEQFDEYSLEEYDVEESDAEESDAEMYDDDENPDGDEIDYPDEESSNYDSQSDSSSFDLSDEVLLYLFALDGFPLRVTQPILVAPIIDAESVREKLSQDFLLEGDHIDFELVPEQIHGSEAILAMQRFTSKMQRSIDAVTYDIDIMINCYDLMLQRLSKQSDIRVTLFAADRMMRHPEVDMATSVTSRQYLLAIEHYGLQIEEENERNNWFTAANTVLSYVITKDELDTNIRVASTHPDPAISTAATSGIFTDSTIDSADKSRIEKELESSSGVYPHCYSRLRNLAKIFGLYEEMNRPPVSAAKLRREAQPGRIEQLLLKLKCEGLTHNGDWLRFREIKEIITRDTDTFDFSLYIVAGA